MRGLRYKKSGWFNESHRHYLAAKGIKTSYFSRRGVAKVRERIAELNKNLELASLANEQDPKLLNRLKAELIQAQADLEREQKNVGIAQEPPGFRTAEKTPLSVPSANVSGTSAEERLIEIRVTRLPADERREYLENKTKVEENTDKAAMLRENARDLRAEAAAKYLGNYGSEEELKKDMMVQREMGNEEQAEVLQEMLESYRTSPEMERAKSLNAEAKELSSEAKELSSRNSKLIGEPSLPLVPTIFSRPNAKRKFIAGGSEARAEAVEGLEAEQEVRKNPTMVPGTKAEEKTEFGTMMKGGRRVSTGEAQEASKLLEDEAVERRRLRAEMRGLPFDEKAVREEIAEKRKRGQPFHARKGRYEIPLEEHDLSQDKDVLRQVGMVEKDVRMLRKEAQKSSGSMRKWDQKLTADLQKLRDLQQDDIDASKMAKWE